MLNIVNTRHVRGENARGRDAESNPRGIPYRTPRVAEQAEMPRRVTQ